MNSNPQVQSTVDKTFLNDVIRGLGKLNKELHCKYFYDERGSKLFDKICELDEYYLTRTEQKIMDRYAFEMASALDEGVMLVEFGSGSSTKTRVLLDNLIQPAAYVPIDISEDHLNQTADELRRRFPNVEVLPVAGDFTGEIRLPDPTTQPTHTAVYFPGSTIGNFVPDDAQRLLKKIAVMVGLQGGLLIGIDLQKDPAIIHAAYNDSGGITDEFNLNILHHINRELGADFNMSQFRHLAEYNAEKARVEIFVVSDCDQTVRVGEEQFQFAAGETIFTEFSHKYTVDGFSAMAASAGFRHHHHWTDKDNFFAVLHLVAEELPDR